MKPRYEALLSICVRIKIGEEVTEGRLSLILPVQGVEESLRTVTYCFCWPLPAGQILPCPTPPGFPDAPFLGSTGVVDTWFQPRPAPSLTRQATDFTPGLRPSFYFLFYFYFS